MVIVVAGWWRKNYQPSFATIDITTNTPKWQQLATSSSVSVQVNHKWWCYSMDWPLKPSQIHQSSPALFLDHSIGWVLTYFGLLRGQNTPGAVSQPRSQKPVYSELMMELPYHLDPRSLSPSPSLVPIGCPTIATPPDPPPCAADARASCQAEAGLVPSHGLVV